ncbi:hypothetical protein SNEBB_000969 [Seison nebaliae]|nr:hypothetical protein SNEBB_000969 [Seison nebaliae]
MFEHVHFLRDVVSNRVRNYILKRVLLPYVIESVDVNELDTTRFGEVESPDFIFGLLNNNNNVGCLIHYSSDSYGFLYHSDGNVYCYLIGSLVSLRMERDIEQLLCKYADLYGWDLTYITGVEDVFEDGDTIFKCLSMLGRLSGGIARNFNISDLVRP